MGSPPRLPPEPSTAILHRHGLSRQSKTGLGERVRGPASPVRADRTRSGARDPVGSRPVERSPCESSRPPGSGDGTSGHCTRTAHRCVRGCARSEAAAAVPHHGSRPCSMEGRRTPVSDAECGDPSAVPGERDLRHSANLRGVQNCLQPGAGEWGETDFSVSGSHRLAVWVIGLIGLTGRLADCAAASFPEAAARRSKVKGRSRMCGPRPRAGASVVETGAASCFRRKRRPRGARSAGLPLWQACARWRLETRRRSGAGACAAPSSSPRPPSPSWRSIG